MTTFTALTHKALAAVSGQQHRFSRDIPQGMPVVESGKPENESNLSFGGLTE
jgi:hypothetical protein